MTLDDFTYLLKEPCSISPEQTLEMDTIMKLYPYFQVAHVLHLKGLKKEHSFKYNKALKTTAGYTTNRTILFDFITADTLDIERQYLKERKILQEAEVIDFEVVDKTIIATAEDAIIKKKPILESLQIGTPLDFETNEMHSFNEWLQLSFFKPIERSEEPVEVIDEGKSKNFELIDQFIATKPKIKPVVATNTIDISSESSKENESLMTETLARVYLEQKKYGKAIKAFKILSLKYPEKSGFFADRIKAVKFLQQNNS
jgi:hypothetical protein